MTQAESNSRELERAVARVHRADVRAASALHALQTTSKRNLVATGAALGLGMLALGALTRRRPRTAVHPASVVARTGWLAAFVPVVVDLALRGLAARSATPPGVRERQRSRPVVH
jgi:hypothetical protein